MSAGPRISDVIKTCWGNPRKSLANLTDSSWKRDSFYAKPGVSWARIGPVFTFSMALTLPILTFCQFLVVFAISLVFAVFAKYPYPNSCDTGPAGKSPLLSDESVKFCLGFPWARAHDSVTSQSSHIGQSFLKVSKKSDKKEGIYRQNGELRQWFSIQNNARFHRVLPLGCFLFIFATTWFNRPLFKE